MRGYAQLVSGAKVSSPRFPKIRRRIGVAICTPLIAVFASGCVSTIQQTSVREPTECGPEGCPAHTFRLDFDVPPKTGPARGTGAVDFLIDFFENSPSPNIDKEMNANGFVCGPKCKRIDKTDIEIKAELVPPQGEEGEESKVEKCGLIAVTEEQSFDKDPSLVQIGVLYLHRGGLFDSSVNSWDELCAKKYPGCVLGGASTSSDAANDRDLVVGRPTPNKPLMRTYSIEVLLTCVKGDERGDEMTVSAHITAYRECKEPTAAQCPTPATQTDQTEVPLRTEDGIAEEVPQSSSSMLSEVRPE